MAATAPVPGSRTLPAAPLAPPAGWAARYRELARRVEAARRVSLDGGLCRKVFRAAVLFVLAFGGSAAAAAAASPESGYARIDAHVRAVMEASSIPGLSYALVHDGEIAHLAGFGTADGSGRAMTPQTPVVIGSTGKTLTALAIRQLVVAGRIDENAPIARYLPWFRLATPGAATAITVRDLLEHTSGLATADGQNPAYYEPGLTAEQVVRRLADVRLDRAVGSYEYSNLNYVVLGVVVEAVSGQPYASYLQDHVFGPLSMRHSYASLEPARRDGLAEGHRYLFGLPVAFEEPYASAIVPAGYQISTAEDMARYVAALSNHGRYGGIDIVGAGGSEVDYGIDWRPLLVSSPGYTPGHSGSTLSSNTALMYTPGSRVAVVVLANANPTQLMNLPIGAADIALDVLRLDSGAEPVARAPTVRTAYLVLDAVLLLLGGLVLFEILRLRGWALRLPRARRRRLRLTASVVIDGVVPLLILVGLPLWIGSSGSTPALDLVASWRFLAWTLPDVAFGLLAVAVGLIGVGVVKVVLLMRPGGRRPDNPAASLLLSR